MHLTKQRVAAHNKMDRPGLGALKFRHEHQRQGRVFTAGTASDRTTGQGSHDAGSCSEAGSQETRGAELHPLLLRQGRSADAPGAGGMGQRSRALQAQVAEAGSAVREESEDAGVLWFAFKEGERLFRGTDAPSPRQHALRTINAAT